MAEKHMLESSSSADFEGANSEQKRIKLEEQQLVQPQGKVGVHLDVAGSSGMLTLLADDKVQGSTPDPHNTPPSRVVHARAVPDGCTHQQMIASLSKFGKIS